MEISDHAWLEYEQRKWDLHRWRIMISTYMKARGFTPSGLAKRACLSPATVINLLEGRTQRPAMQTIGACFRAVAMRIPDPIPAGEDGREFLLKSGEIEDLSTLESVMFGK
jgi:transcriptional regulator with XRE-family HTH domain